MIDYELNILYIISFKDSVRIKITAIVHKGIGDNPISFFRMDSTNFSLYADEKVYSKRQFNAEDLF